MLDVFSAPASGDTRYPDVRANYVLIDGSRRAEAERWLYACFDTPDYRNLFDGTAWASVRQAAPLLLCVEPDHPGLEPLLAELKERECGYAMTSDAPLATLTSHLQRFIEVRHPLGHRVLLRIADPSVARVLLAPARDGGIADAWSDITGVMLPDALWDGWHIQQRPEASSGEASDPDRTVTIPHPLNERSLNQLMAVDQRATLVTLLRHLETYFPTRLENRPRADVVLGLRTLMNEALDSGYTSLQALTHWCSVFGYLGPPDTWARVAPEVHRIFRERVPQEGEARAREAAVLARELTRTTTPGRVDTWACP